MELDLQTGSLNEDDLMGNKMSVTCVGSTLLMVAGIMHWFSGMTIASRLTLAFRNLQTDVNASGCSGNCVILNTMP